MKLHIIDENVIINSKSAEIEISDFDLTIYDKNRLVEILENINEKYHNQGLSDYISQYHKLKPQKKKTAQISLFDFDVDNNFNEVIGAKTDFEEKENLGNIKANSIQGDINERDNKYARSNEPTERADQEQSAKLLQQPSAELDKRSAKETNAYEYENSGIYSTGGIQQSSNQNKRTEIELNTGKANSIQDERRDAQREYETSQAYNEQSIAERRIAGKTQRDNEQSRELNRAKESIRDIVTQKEIDDLMAGMPSFDEDIDEIDKSLQEDLKSMRLLSELQENCYDLAVKLMDIKTVENFYKSVNNSKGFSEKFFETNLNYKAKKADYDFLNFNEKAREFFTYFLSLAVAQGKASKIDMPTSEMVGKMLLHQTNNLSILNAAIEQSANNLEYIMGKVADLKELDESSKKRYRR
ncbi:hypothetical protein [Campylobacter sp. RM16187]|uniref:hypothetical protein n=1 Tax=Campylobacter sp. RM16187 TaxID=1660063 RepID=UPI0021B5F287|nr:hypothetical protein [Campylobacter sp. RM16187]QKG30286.1 hypothetical protein CDOMF_a037 [Campylobacter sp. RM16187]